MLDRHRNWFTGLEAGTAKIFAVFPLTPNQYTSLSVAAVLACDFFLLARNYWIALLFFAVSAFLDFIDGAVARAKAQSTKKGAYWDTIADRYVESLLLFGLLFVDLPRFFLPACAWIFLAAVGAMMTTYAKAAAKEKGLSDGELKGGLMSRAERLIFYFAAVVFLNYDSAIAVYIVAALALLSNFTALQRIARALNLVK